MNHGIQAVALGVLALMAVSSPATTAQDTSSGNESEGKDVVYTCSMHPQIVEEEPGTCPICGMDLVPKTLEAGDARDELKGETTAPAHDNDPGHGRKIKAWVAPMDPTYIRDKPGKSPMGMDLVPIYEDESESSQSGMVTIDPVVVQNMGVRIAPVRKGTLFRHVRAIGSVDVAESELSVVNLRYSGWIERIYVDETGEHVQKGQPLFDIYSPEVVSAQEELLLALRGAGKDSPLAKSARRRLELWDLPGWLIDKVVEAGKPMKHLTVVTPRSGYVLHKNVVQGARVPAGVDLYRIGNLTKIWVNTDVYELDAPWIKVGQRATMELSFEAGKTYEGRVSYVLPTLNEKTRTLAVRLAFDNPGLALKPGMFATVRIEAQRKEGILEIPTEAIIHSGTRQVVFVARSLGKYEMRQITTGMVGDGHRTEVMSGLSEGERVVTSGQFLLDSESQLQEAVQKLLDARLQAKTESASQSAEPKAAAAEGEKKPAASSTYWTCGMHPQVVQDHPGTCSICGMDLIEKKR